MKSGPYSRAVAAKAPRPAPAAVAQAFGGALARAGLL
jgi:hypothetical protein